MDGTGPGADPAVDTTAASQAAQTAAPQPQAAATDQVAQQAQTAEVEQQPQTPAAQQVAQVAPVEKPKRMFNPLAAYGTISPPHNGAVHQQDGGYFAPSGELLWEDRPPTPPTIETSEVTTIDSLTGEIKTDLIETEVPTVEPGNPKEILALWLTGEAKLAHGTVRGQVKKAFGVVLSTKEEIINYLVNEAHLVAAEVVRVI